MKTKKFFKKNWAVISLIIVLIGTAIITVIACLNFANNKNSIEKNNTPSVEEAERYLKIFLQTNEEVKFIRTESYGEDYLHFYFRADDTPSASYGYCPHFFKVIFEFIEPQPFYKYWVYERVVTSWRDEAYE